MHKRREQDPGLLAWSLALISLALPWVGFPLVLYGGVVIAQGSADGWMVLLAGVAALTVDIAIDLVWADPRISRTDEPSLNAPARQLVGRACTVVEPISGGRGRVRIGDTEWVAEGPDAAAGARVWVIGSRGTNLLVGPEPTHG